jgi:AcrR family transcriptional regulator
MTEERFSDRMRRERIQTITRAAAHLLAEKGVADLRLDEVARRSGVAKGTIYLDFGSKEELLEAARGMCREEVLETIHQRASSVVDPVQRLRAVLRTIAELPFERPYLDAIFTTADPASGSWPDAQLSAVVAEFVAEARTASGVRVGPDAELAAQAILATTIVPAWRRTVSERGADHAVERVLRALSA